MPDLLTIAEVASLLRTTPGGGAPEDRPRASAGRIVGAVGAGGSYFLEGLKHWYTSAVGLSKMEYRLNYGNGQVSDTFTCYKVARAAFRAQVEFDARCKTSSASLQIQRYAGDGEWIGLGKAGRPVVEGPRS